MAGKRSASRAAASRPESPIAAGRPDTGRDFVTFYSRLTQSLEKSFGAENLADRLACIRKRGSAEPVEIREAAAARAFRRLGWLRSGDDAAEFLLEFRRELSDAVSRPPVQVDELLRLFCTGDETLGAKPVCGPTPYCKECSLTRECDHFNNPRTPALAALTPAQRLLAGHEQSLSDAELLAVTLFGDKATGQEPVAANLLARYGRLRALFRAESGEYRAIRDVGPTLALRLAAYSALYRRLLVERRNAMLHISSAKDIYDRYAAELREYKVEATVLLMLDQRHNVIRDAWFCAESPNSARIRVVDLLRPAVRECAVGVALVRNHPSGSASPSRADDDFTKQLSQACKLFDLGLLDHVIVADSGFYSYLEAGLLDARAD